MKTLFKIFAGIGAVVVIAIAAVFYFTAGMADTADKFFLAVKSNNYDKAYTYLSEDFKNNTDKQQLKSFLENNSLSQFKESSWNSRSIEGSRGELVGSITTESGGVIPISLNFIKADDWLIYSIQKPNSGIKQESQKSELPSEKVQIDLVNESMRIFAVAVSEKSMNKMFAHISHYWQKQYSEQKFTETFKDFYQFGNALMVLDQYSPQFSEAGKLNDEGILIIKGIYPTKPSQVLFTHKYIYEGLGWKLIGFKVNVE